MDTVSVIIPTHNRRTACRRAIESVLAQTVPPLEVLVCDDRSADDTAVMVHELAERDPRVRYLARTEGPPGPGGTRNLGLAEARGNWVAFLDDDDTWLPRKLELQLAAGSNRFDLVAGNAHRLSGGLYFQHPAPQLVVEYAALLRENPIIISTVLVRRDAVESVGRFGIETWLGAVADYDLWLRLASARTRMMVLGAPLIVYDDSGEERLSAAPMGMQVALARLAMRRWAAAPRDRALRGAALAHVVNAADFAIGTVGARARARARTLLGSANAES
jgi:glycosyltransferase involved in cell wall biosynthesis